MHNTLDILDFANALTQATGRHVTDGQRGARLDARHVHTRLIWRLEPTTFGTDNNRMVSFSGGGGGAALGSPTGILILLVVIAVVGLVWWLFNR